MTVADVALIRPNWLWAFLPLIGLAWGLFGRRQKLGAWENATNPHLLNAMRAFGYVDSGGKDWSLAAPFLTAGFIILALSGPAVERRDTVSFRNLDAVVFVVDLSPSVTESPIWPEVLTFTRFGISALQTRPAALIVYAGDAYIAADLSHDHTQLGQTVSLLEPGMIPDPGTRPERGLAMSGDIFDATDIISGDVVLITDGANLDTTVADQIARLAQSNIRTSIVYTTAQAPPLGALAKIGNGQHFGLRDIDAFANWLQQDARTRLVEQHYPLLFQKDLGRYVLIFAAVTMLFMFRRSST